MTGTSRLARGMPLSLGIGWLIFAAAAQAQAQTERIEMQPVGVVSWGEMLRTEAKILARPSKSVPREIPFLPGLGPRQITAPAAWGPAAPDRASLRSTNAATCAGATGEPVLADTFQGLSDNNTRIPPDTMGAVGPNHVMTMLNTEVLVQNKSGCLLGRVSLGTFWSSAASSPFDPKLVYDSLSGRFIAVVDAYARSGLSGFALAVSATSDPTGSWFFFFIDADSTDTYWADYPGLGVNSTWIAITNNMFTISSNSFYYAKMWVIDKAAMLAGGSFTTSIFPQGFDISGNVYGATLQPAVTFDASESTLYLTDYSGWQYGSNRQLVRISRITGAGTAPSWSVVPGSMFSSTGLFEVANNFWNVYQVDAAQLGAATRIETNDTRMINAVFRNGRLWCTHTGALPAPPSSTIDRTAVFWYQLNPAAMPNPIVQSGVLDGGFDVHHFFPSITANCGDDACVGFTRSDSTRYAEAAYVCRAASDPAGTMRPIRVLKVGEDSYVKDFNSGRNRWGDYSATCVDPTDDRTFWTVQEYAALSVGNGVYDDRWGTWWGKLVPTGAEAESGIQDAQNAVMITDCNDNGTDDGCDIATGTSEDCNLNVIPDECDVDLGNSLDCNENFRPDECDLSLQFSLDCDFDEVPDECESDCNGNAVPDPCDIGTNFSADCNTNGVPDDCESPDCPAALVLFDINSGGDYSSSSDYEVTYSTGQHGGVGLLTGGPYTLSDGFWHTVASFGPAAPDALESDPNHVNKNRFIGFVVPAPAANRGPGTLTALRVTLSTLNHPRFCCTTAGGTSCSATTCNVDSQCSGVPGNPLCAHQALAGAPDYSAMQDKIRYVNSFTFPAEAGALDCPDDGPPFNTSYKCATLGCEPEYRDWAADLATPGPNQPQVPGLIYITGDALVPSSTVEISHIAASCGAAATANTCTSASAPLAVGTARWGDLNGAGFSAPDGKSDVLDIPPIVNKLKTVSPIFPEPRLWLKQRDPVPNTDAITVIDLSDVVDAGPQAKAYPASRTIDSCPHD